MAMAARPLSAVPFGTLGQPGAVFEPPSVSQNAITQPTQHQQQSQPQPTMMTTHATPRKPPPRSRAAKLVMPIRKVAYLQWRQKLRRIINNRLEQEAFSRVSKDMMRDHYIPPDVLSDLLLQPRNTAYMLDARVVLYINSALDDGLIDVPGVLLALHRRSSLGALGKPAEVVPRGEQRQRWISSYSTDEVIMWRLTKIMNKSMNGELPANQAMSVDTALHIVNRTAMWIDLFINVFATLANHVMGHYQDPNLRAEIHSTHGAFVGFLLKMSEHPRVLRALAKPFATKFRRAITHNLELFISSLAATEIADRLSAFRLRILALDPKPENHRMMEVEDEPVMDEASAALALESLATKHIIPTNSRAGLYIYLNATLVGRPIIDDDILCNLIRNRYQNDMQPGIVDLILASFGVLSNAAIRNEHASTSHLLRSFLTNKLPLLIATLSAGLYPPATAEFCITTALNQVDPNTFPTLSTMFDARNNTSPLTENMREEFCFACCLHGLVAQSSIPALLGETYSSLPAGGKYTKAALVAECQTDPERAFKLLTELDKTDGNVGAVCHAVVELFCQMCAAGDTAQLRSLCSQLARQPRSLDVIQLFERPVTLLQPLCTLLDSWKYDEDQGDYQYQPVYEEFGSILLLVMAFAYRYNLSPPDMGLRSPDSFVAQLIRGGHLNKANDELTPTQDKHLSGWIEGLFGTEAAGLTDELMASCPPQDFYLLVATLFKNMVVANSEGVLSDEMLGTGIEYLVDTFLMPALVPAVLFLADQLSVDQEPEQLAMIKILHLILKPANVHADTRPTLIAVMNLTAKPLERALRRYQRRYPSSHDVEPLLAAISDAIPLSRRTGGADHNELEAWCATPGGGLAIAVKQTIQGFVNWSLNPMVGATPTLYTHRQMLAAIRRMTAQHVIRLIIDEIKSHSSMGMPALQIMYDVAIALIIAPEVTNYPEPVPVGEAAISLTARIPTQRRLTLREVLAMKAASWREFQRTDSTKAEIVVRLHREVEAQMAPAAVPVILQEMAGMPLVAEAEEDKMNAAAAAAAAVGSTVDMPDSMDLSMDMSLVDMGSGGGSGGLDLGADGDLFGGLSGQDDFNWEAIDMMGL